jgi:hypothetical protein
MRWLVWGRFNWGSGSSPRIKDDGLKPGRSIDCFADGFQYYDATYVTSFTVVEAGYCIGDCGKGTFYHRTYDELGPTYNKEEADPTGERKRWQSKTSDLPYGDAATFQCKQDFFGS